MIKAEKLLHDVTYTYYINIYMKYVKTWNKFTLITK